MIKLDFLLNSYRLFYYKKIRKISKGNLDNFSVGFWGKLG